MLLWILFAALTAAVVVPLVRPLLASAPAAARADDPDLSVYRDQLAEIERDRSREMLEPAEAEQARAEIARRLLRSAERDAARTRGADAPGLARAALAIAAVGVPLATVVLYTTVGAPWLPQRPHAARAAATPQQATIDELVTRVEARLRSAPDDGQGWDVIAPIYLRQQRFQEAAQAFARALRLLGETPKRLAGLAEAQVLANNGIVTEDARRNYERLAALEPDRPEPRFWLALAKEQDGKLAEARADFEAMLAKAPADAPWRATVAERVETLTARLSGAPPPPGPSAEDMKAASRLSPEDQSRMIGQMVDGLAERLKTNGRDVEGWQRLLRAYSVLGQAEKAKGALADARRALAGDTAALARLDEVARSLGIGS